MNFELIKSMSIDRVKAYITTLLQMLGNKRLQNSILLQMRISVYFRSTNYYEQFHTRKSFSIFIYIRWADQLIERNKCCWCIYLKLTMLVWFLRHIIVLTVVVYGFYYRIVLIIGMKIWSMLHSACLVVFRYMKLVYLYYVFFCFTF